MTPDQAKWLAHNMVSPRQRHQTRLPRRDSTCSCRPSHTCPMGNTDTPSHRWTLPHLSQVKHRSGPTYIQHRARTCPWRKKEDLGSACPREGWSAPPGPRMHPLATGALLALAHGKEPHPGIGAMPPMPMPMGVPE
eukprot:CAMPEP_0115758082 /NCGR_PEP_ID=MMETSP0272-20121206/98751_1 /TAXON_ID=71861 /ORGANISM="Scrippsiella trochoidea, Strain CCMP3099" /LENGTH=135 /DNA_ID=CAMNT_0003203607 /DNA_START=52 /DNA_END=460 /DNA_ORIENTATION=+